MSDMLQLVVNVPILNSLSQGNLSGPPYRNNPLARLTLTDFGDIESSKR